LSTYSLWPIPTLSCELQSGVVQCAVSAQINCHIKSVSSLVTQFVNFDPKTFVFLGCVLSGNDPSFVLNNNFIYDQMFRRVVKF
jgi:hypothetical protein